MIIYFDKEAYTCTWIQLNLNEGNSLRSDPGLIILAIMIMVTTGIGQYV